MIRVVGNRHIVIFARENKIERKSSSRRPRRYWRSSASKIKHVNVFSMVSKVGKLVNFHLDLILVASGLYSNLTKTPP